MSNKYQWSEEQIKELKALYPTTCICDISDKLGISYDVVRRKAVALGLKRAEGFTSFNHYGRYVRKGNHLNGMS